MNTSFINEADNTVFCSDVPVNTTSATSIIVKYLAGTNAVNGLSVGQFVYATSGSFDGYKYTPGGDFGTTAANMIIPANEKLEFLIHDPDSNLTVSNFNGFVPISTQTLNSRNPTDFYPELVTQTGSVVREGADFQIDVTLYYVVNGWYVSAIFYTEKLPVLREAALSYIGSKLYTPPDHFASHPAALSVFDAFRSSPAKTTLYEIRPDDTSAYAVPFAVVHLADII